MLCVFSCTVFGWLPLVKSVPYSAPIFWRNQYKQALEHLDPVLAGQPVATDHPWLVIANTHSPAVMIPSAPANTQAAIFSKYQVRWIVMLFGQWPTNKMKPFGPYSVELHKQEGPIKLYRLSVPRS